MLLFFLHGDDPFVLCFKIFFFSEHVLETLLYCQFFGSSVFLSVALAQGLAHSRCWVNACWTKEQNWKGRTTCKDNILRGKLSRIYIGVRRRQTLEPKKWEGSYKDLKSWKSQVYTFSVVLQSFQFALIYCHVLNIIVIWHCVKMLYWSQPINSNAIGWERLGALTWACITCDKPHFANVVAGAALMVLIIWLQDTRQQQPSGNFAEQDLLFTGSGGYMACPSTTQAWSWIEREHVDLRLCLY